MPVPEVEQTACLPLPPASKYLLIPMTLQLADVQGVFHLGAVHQLIPPDSYFTVTTQWVTTVSILNWCSTLDVEYSSFKFWHNMAQSSSDSWMSSFVMDCHHLPRIVMSNFYIYINMCCQHSASWVYNRKSSKTSAALIHRWQVLQVTKSLRSAATLSKEQAKAGARYAAAASIHAMAADNETCFYWEHYMLHSLRYTVLMQHEFLVVLWCHHLIVLRLLFFVNFG